MTEQQPSAFITQPLAGTRLGKALGLCGTTVVLSALAWWFVHQTLVEAFTNATVRHAWMPLLFAFLFLFLMFASAGITSMVVHDRRYSYGTMAAMTLLFLAVFGVGWYAVVAALLILAGLLQFDWNVKHEQQQRIRVAIQRTMHYGLYTAILLALLAVSVVVYGKLADEQNQQGATNVVVSIAAGAVNESLGYVVQDYDEHEPLDQFLLRVAAERAQDVLEEKIEQDEETARAFENVDVSDPGALVEQITGVSLDELLAHLPAEELERVKGDPEALREALIATLPDKFDEEIGFVRNDLLARLDVQADGATPVGEVVERLLQKHLAPEVSTFAAYFPPVIALAVFFTLATFIFLYVVIINVMTTGLFALLKALKFFSIERRAANVEVIVLL